MKRYIALILALLMSLLAGCGQEPPVADVTGAADAADAQISMPTATATPDTSEPVEPAIDHETILAELDLSENAKSELLHAAEIGLPLDKAAQQTISGAELAELLDIFVFHADPEKLAEWKTLYPVLRASTEPLIRFDAMASLFLAAYHVGDDYDYANPSVIQASQSLNHTWDKDYLNWNLYGGWNALPTYTIGGNDFGYLDGASYYYFLSCKEYPFEYDEQTNSLRVEDNCTYAEALRAIWRLMANYDPVLNPQHSPEQKAHDAVHSILTDSEFYFTEETDTVAPYYQLAQERKDSILNSPTSIVKSDTFIRGETYTGTAYYISENGNDNNDGLTPETAWRSANRFAWGDVDLQPGDAVFFERGSVFRLTDYCIQLEDGVTYSAYGEGAKPVFTRSKENSANSEYWELWYEDETGKKIWRYHELLGDVGGITFDDTIGAKRVWEVPSPEGWLATNVTCFDPVSGIYGDHDPYSLSWWETTDEYRSVEENLTEDMT